MKTKRVTQAEFGRLVGISRSRINQLVKMGLLFDDGNGLPLVESLKRYYVYRTIRRNRDIQPSDDYFLKFLLRV